MSAINTGKMTNDGLAVYDLDPQATELWAVAGPDGIDPRTIDADDLPEGFRWVTESEWEAINETAFIAVFRPHQRPAWAQVFESEQRFTDAWAHGNFDHSCHCNGDLTEEERELTFANAWADARHDLYCLTRLDSAQEIEQYLSGSEYYGHHNKAIGDVRRCAEELGWMAVKGDN